jgi:hypothetical protein
MTPRTPSDQSSEYIDLTEVVDSIRSKYGERSHAIPAAMWEAAALWGVTPETASIDDCGVFTSANDEITLHSGGCKAHVILVQAPNGNWAMSTRYDTRVSGAGYAPSVWNRQAFRTRDDARLAALGELIQRFGQEERDPGSLKGESNRRDVRQMIALPEAEKTPQLALF